MERSSVYAVARVECSSLSLKPEQKECIKYIFDGKDFNTEEVLDSCRNTLLCCKNSCYILSEYCSSAQAAGIVSNR